MNAAFDVIKDDPKPISLRKLGITLDVLDRKSFPELREIVPGILPEGLTILGGRIKLGKSWLMYDVSTAVAYGGHALSSIPVEQGDVLHLALEDGERRVQSRLRQMLGDVASPSGANYMKPMRAWIRVGSRKLKHGQRTNRIRAWLSLTR
jgi:hypothetical protein